ncbi:MAG: LysR substrate-binding domain-containing protein [bacterium]
MNLQQLRIVREAVRRRFNLTEVANALYTSPSGVSRHLLDLEDELGVQLFVRRGKRLLGLTPPGQELVPMVERALLELGNIRRLAEHYAQRDEGTLRIATTHTQARYALPPIVGQFRTAWPRVNLLLHQGTPTEIACMLLADEADIGVATEALAEEHDLQCYPFYRWRHGVLVPRGHPLAVTPPAALTLAALADYPLVTYHDGVTGRQRIDEAFASAGLHPQVALAALDSDVLKAYVELGLGVGIIAPAAFSPESDTGLVLLAADHLFEENTTLIAVPRNRLLRRYAMDFLHRCCPQAAHAAADAGPRAAPTLPAARP